VQAAGASSVQVQKRKASPVTAGCDCIENDVAETRLQPARAKRCGNLKQLHVNVDEMRIEVGKSGVLR
jgi:hypothetical protein